MALLFINIKKHKNPLLSHQKDFLKIQYIFFKDILYKYIGLYS